MLLKFAAPLLLFLSSALDAANNASYENTSDQERYVFPIPDVNFLFETILKPHPIFYSLLRSFYSYHFLHEWPRTLRISYVNFLFESISKLHPIFLS